MNKQEIKDKIKSVKWYIQYHELSEVGYRAQLKWLIQELRGK